MPVDIRVHIPYSPPTNPISLIHPPEPFSVSIKTMSAAPINSRPMARVSRRSIMEYMALTNALLSRAAIGGSENDHILNARGLSDR